MWKFSDIPYQRPDVPKIEADYRAATQGLAAATSYAEAREAYLAQDRALRGFMTVFTVAGIRQTIDTADAFYEEEMKFLNRAMAQFSPLMKRANEALLASPFRAGFEAEYGGELLTKAELEQRTQSEAIVADLVEQSDLEEAYKLLVASCSVEFRGEPCNFYGLLKHMEDPDRSVRRAAFVEWANLYKGVSERLDELYDKLIAVRLRIADKLSFASYTDLAYAGMGRSAYGPADVEAFRRQVRQVIVPAAAALRQRQAERIGVPSLRYYDENFVFLDGNADPVGGEDVLLPIGRRMYRELSKETGEFFDFLIDHGLFDLETRPGKHLGGYCTYLPDHGAPFIFSNFNGTSADVGVLTHEAGHALAAYAAARHQPIMAYFHSTAEICEIHSMAMEHFTYPWLKDLYGAENVEKARFAHLAEAIAVIPYLVCVDEFQHRVFENPGMSAAQRNALWRELEGAYMPWRDYDGNPFLESGGFWMQKQHVFLYPFYYIDYALAHVCAFELYGRMKDAPAEAWADYMRLCSAGGSKGFFELLALANLGSPFADGAVARAAGHVIAELDGYTWPKP